MGGGGGGGYGRKCESFLTSHRKREENKRRGGEREREIASKFVVDTFYDTHYYLQGVSNRWNQLK